MSLNGSKMELIIGVGYNEFSPAQFDPEFVLMLEIRKIINLLPCLLKLPVKIIIKRG